MPSELRFEACDTEIVNQMRRSMKKTGYPQLQSIQCEADGSTAILRGRLRSYYLLQMAQTAAMNVDGVQRVINLVTVAPT